MKFAINAEHHQYFQKHQLLELEGLLAEPQIAILSEAIEKALLKKTQTPADRGHRLYAEQRFEAGADMWRSDPAIAKIVCNTQWATIAAELTKQRIIRLGYDLWFPSTPAQAPTRKEISSYDHLLSQSPTLESICCLKGACCGLMICLKSAPEAPEGHEGIFPFTAGNGVYFSLDKTLDFPTLRQRPDQQFLMILYTEKTALYTLNRDDPHQNEFKKLGYVYGDKLKDNLNPILLRI